MKSRPERWLLLYQSAVGLCDASTGALLLAAPVWTLRLMGLRIVPEPLAFVRFVGIFVACVGLGYLWAAIRYPICLWRGQWMTTALIRSGVALFLAWQIAGGAMEQGWVTVVATDGILAAVQWIGLSRRWLCRDDQR
jgi:hypothetical protein